MAIPQALTLFPGLPLYKYFPLFMFQISSRFPPPQTSPSSPLGSLFTLHYTAPQALKTRVSKNKTPNGLHSERLKVSGDTFLADSRQWWVFFISPPLWAIPKALWDSICVISRPAGPWEPLPRLLSSSSHPLISWPPSHPSPRLRSAPPTSRSCSGKTTHQSSQYPAAAAKSLQSCPTLCDPIESSPPGSLVPGILQARTPEWVAISFSNAGK